MDLLVAAEYLSLRKRVPHAGKCRKSVAKTVFSVPPPQSEFVRIKIKFRFGPGRETRCIRSPHHGRKLYPEFHVLGHNTVMPIRIIAIIFLIDLTITDKIMKKKTQQRIFYNRRERFRRIPIRAIRTRVRWDSRRDLKNNEKKKTPSRIK